MSGPGRVVFFVAYPHAYGGVERSLELLATGLQQREWAVSIVLPGHGVAVERFRAAGVDARAVLAPPSLLVYGKATRGWKAVAAARDLPGYWWKLSRQLQGADLVHAFDQRGLVLAGPAARLAGVPSIWHVVNMDSGPLLNAIAARLASAVIAVSRPAADRLPPSRVTVVPNAVAQRAFDVAAAPGSPPFDIACAARFIEDKGVDVLVRATALLRQDRPDVRVLVLGGAPEGHGAYEAEVIGLARELGVADAVCFKGFVDDAVRHWAGARVYVQPSRREGFGLAAAEAMAGGLPVVASAVGGLTDVLDHGAAGVLVPPDDPRALASAVKGLLDDPAEAARLAKAGRARVEAEYSVDGMLDKVEAVYRSVISPG